MFSKTVMEMRGGLEAALSEQLSAVLQAVEQTGRPGALTLTLSIKKNGDAVNITPKVSAKKPEPTVGDSMFFVTSDFKLSRQNPKQMDIEDQLAVRREAKAGETA